MLATPLSFQEVSVAPLWAWLWQVKLTKFITIKTIWKHSLNPTNQPNKSQYAVENKKNKSIPIIIMGKYLNTDKKTRRTVNSPLIPNQRYNQSCKTQS